MNKFLRRTLSTIFSILLASAAFAQSPGATKLYAVIFEVTVDAAGKVNSLKISKVIDPNTGSTDAIDLPVPEEYVTAVRKHLLKRTYDTKDGQFYTYIFYDPAHPSRADIDPNATRQ